MQTILVVLVFGGLIFFHELGHFLVARYFSMGVKTFSLGFGPVLFSRVKGKTRYQIASIPLGGYVALVGEAPDAEIPEPFTKEESFSLRPAWQRFFVIVAGSVFNLVLAWIICWGLMFHYGKIEVDPIIGEVKAESAAAEAGLFSGDRILALNDTTITRWDQIPFFLQINQSNPVQVQIDRPGLGPHQLTVTPKLTEQEVGPGEVISSWLFGITPKEPRHVELSFFEAASEGAEKAKNMLVYTWVSLKALATQEIPASSMGGPIGIAQVIYKKAEQGIGDVLLMAALISVNLGFLNLLPIPVLDGGHLVFITFEMITKKAVPPHIQHKAMMVGLTLLLGLMFFATFNDIVRIFS